MGVLTQYKPLELNVISARARSWDLTPPAAACLFYRPIPRGSEWYKGTANAIYQNLSFIAQYNPDYVLILSGDHIYKCDYSEMLSHHIKRGAALTVWCGRCSGRTPAALA